MATIGPRADVFASFLVEDQHTLSFEAFFLLCYIAQDSLTCVYVPCDFPYPQGVLLPARLALLSFGWRFSVAGGWRF